jgi:hypothetical protein
MNGRLAGVLIFEMTDCLFVTTRRVQLNGSLLPFQFGARSQAKNERQCKSENVGFHFLE